jgi:phenylalanyl-tRNA synthetase beta chain
MAYLRTSLIPGTLSVIQKNIYGGEKNLFLFELGNIFNQLKDGKIQSFDDFEEKPRLLFAISGKVFEKGWNQEEKLSDFYILKGWINSFLSKISLDNVLNDFYYQDENRIFDITFSKRLGKSEIGTGGKVKQEVLRLFDIEQEVYCFEFDFNALRSVNPKQVAYKEPLKFPKVIRDFAFIFDRDTNFEEVRNYILTSGAGLLKSVDIFDIFESSSLGENKKSMAFTLQFYDENRTLTEAEVEKEFSSLISLIEQRFNAKLRGT